MTTGFDLHASWREPLRDEFDKPYMVRLRAFLLAEEAAGKRIFPEASLRFRALDLTPLDAVGVVILGQDPYHGPGQAHGLSFSVLPGARKPPSLQNIYKELRDDVGIAPASHGFLEHWAEQGVLLLNSVLTVEQGKAASHQGKGWENFTEAVVRLVSALSDPVVFLLWGRQAHKQATLIDSQRHLVLKAAHPSPLSAYNGFFGCRHFSQANAFLATQGRGTIDWALPLAASATKA